MGSIKKNIVSKFRIFRELIVFLWKRKLWWLMPIIIFLLLMGILLIFTQSSAVAPFIYTLF